MLGQPTLSGPGEVLLGILVAIAAYYDIRFRRIPNWLVLVGIITGLTWNSLSSGGFLWGGFSSDDPGLLRAGKGLLVGFLLYFPLYLIRGRRAGDVKLLAAVGSIIGPGNCFWFFLLSNILGGVIALVIIALHKRVGKTFFNVGWIVGDLLHFKAPYKSSPEPHAAMMAAGAGAFIVMAQYGVTI
jgi:prepilin peptidase CpaA